LHLIETRVVHNYAIEAIFLCQQTSTIGEPPQMNPGMVKSPKILCFTLTVGLRLRSDIIM